PPPSSSRARAGTSPTTRARAGARTARGSRRRGRAASPRARSPRARRRRARRRPRRARARPPPPPAPRTAAAPPTPDPAPLRPPAARAGALAFLTAGVALLVQVLVHRIISVKFLNNYAFLVISLTMLGFAVSGALLARFSDRALASLEDVLVSCAALFAI